MFGGAYGGGAVSPWAGLRNAFAAPAAVGQGQFGQGSAYAGLGGVGQQLMQAGQPRFASQPQQQPMPMGGLGAGNMGGMGGSMFGGMPQQQPQIPPHILQLLQQRLGPTSEAGWGVGTTTTPTPSRWASPQNLFGSMFNPGAYR
jgi:hypothetical protein